MTKSADRPRVNARSTKAELLDEIKFLRSRIKKLERDTARLEKQSRELGDNEGRLAALVEHMPAVAFVRDLNGRYELVNRCYEDAYAVSNKRIRGKGLEDVFPKATATKYAAHDRRVIDEQRVIEEEIVVERDGAQRVYSAVKFPILEKAGKMIAIGGIEQDITDRKAAEAELRDSEGRFRSLVENTRSVAFRYLLDDAYTLEYFGGAVEQITGYPRADFEGNAVRSYASIVHPDDADRVRQEIETAVAANRDFTIEYRILHRDGADRWVHSVGQPVTDADGALKWIDGTLFDITERKQAEEILERSREQLYAILDSSPAGIVVTLRDSGEVVFANARIAEQLKLGKDREIGNVLNDYWADPGERDGLIGRARQGKTLRDVEVRRRRSDGSEFWALMSALPVDYEGQKALLTWTYDITARKAAEEMAGKRADQLRAVLDNIPAGLYLANADLEIEVFNDQFGQLYGFPDGLMYEGQTLPALIRWLAEHGNYGDEDVEAAVETRVAALRSGIAGSREQSPPTGSPIQLSYGPAGDGGVCGVIIDITETKKAEARFKALLESAPDATVIVDEDGTIVQINQQTERLFGYGAGVLLGQKVETLLPKRFRKAHPALRKRFFADTEVRPMGAGLELYGQASDGREFPIEISLSPIETDEGLLVSASVRDITERKEAESALRDSEERFKAVIDQLPTMVTVKDTALQLTMANRKYREWFDFDDKDFVGRSSFDLYAKEIAEEMVRLDHEVLKTGEAVDRETEAMFADGALHTVSLTKFPIKSAAGNVIAIGAVASDITERKAAEDALRESEARFKSVVDQLPGMIVIKDDQQRYTLVNRTWREWFGQSEADIVGRTSFDLYSKDLAEELVRLDGQILKTGKTVEQEMQAQFADGTEHTVLLSKFPIRSAAGDILAVGAIGTDITERKRLEEELRQNEKQLRRIFEDSPIAIAISLDDQSDEDGSIQFANARFLDMLGFSADQIGKARTDQFFRNFEHREEHERVLDRGEALRDMEMRVHRQDGEELVTLGSINPITFDGRKSALIWLYDISDRKRAEEEVRLAKERAETALADLKAAQQRLVVTEKMASLGQLTAGIAHEIKNPLNFVNNFSETSVELLDELTEALEPVREGFDKDTREEVDDVVETLKGDLQKINLHGKRADSIVKSMLLHSRGDASERLSISVNDLVEEAFGLSYHGERARDKSFQATMEQNLDEAAGEAEMVSQEINRVLVNLFSNAFYAVKKRGAETGDAEYTPTVTATTRDLGGEIEIRIRDNGTGMPAEVRDKLFEPFFTTKPAGEGTGLGLSMSFDIIVQQHGGRIEVESEPGGFTEFIIRLPRRSGDGPSGAATEESA